MTGATGDGLPEPATPAELQRIAEAWKPYRTWTSVLIRVAGDRVGLAGDR